MWEATVGELVAARQAEPLSVRQIAAQLLGLRAAGVGYWEDRTEAEEAAGLTIWRDALATIPAPFALAAFRAWASTMNRRPAPGDIANWACRMLNDAAGRVRHEAPPRIERDEADIGRRREFAAKMAEHFPILKGVPK